MAFRLLTPSSKGSACETSANESFYGGRKKILCWTSLLSYSADAPAGYSNKNSKKNSDKHKRAGEDGKREKASLGPLTGRFAYESLACVASVSARVRRERWDESKKKKRKEWRGRGRGEKETLARKPHDFEKLRSPTNAASDWCGGGSVDYLALETSIKPGMLCLQASQIWSHLICGRRLQMLWTWIVFVQRFMRSESSKYIWKSSSGD